MNLVVIGAQWGDEGKGKIVDYLAENTDTVVRFSGGANAGHTIVTGGKTYKLHLIPSGIIYPGKKVILGTGMVIDPEAMFTELSILTESGINWEGRVFISDRAHLVLPRHKREDIELDKKRENPIGTTGRGIGITYSKKAGRDGVRVGDIYDNDVFNALSPGDREYLTEYKDKMKDMVINAAYFMYDIGKRQGCNILFEGAQGALLDLDTGTYPYVSSGYSCSAGASIGGGIGPGKLDKILGVFKAYSTRVGNGPFPSEFKKERDGDLEDTVRTIGNEFGVTTGRPRRCGYLDLVALKYSCMVNSLDSLVLTHPDVYDTFETVKVCTGYMIDGKETKEFPSSIEKLKKAVPVIEEMKGWNKSLRDCGSYDNLPREAADYIEFIENYTETEVSIISTGPDRKHTFMRKDPWTKY